MSEIRSGDLLRPSDRSPTPRFFYMNGFWKPQENADAFVFVLQLNAYYYLIDWKLWLVELKNLKLRALSSLVFK